MKERLNIFRSANHQAVDTRVDQLAEASVRAVLRSSDDSTKAPVQCPDGASHPPVQRGKPNSQPAKGGSFPDSGDDPGLRHAEAAAAVDHAARVELWRAERQSWVEYAYAPR